MKRAEVKRMLREKNLTYYRLGKKWRVTSAMVSNFINGKTKSARLERRLAEELGVTAEQLRGEERAAS